MRVLLDTNILIAAFVSRGSCESLLDHCSLHHELITSEALLDELRRVLSDKLGASKREVAFALESYRRAVLLVEPAEVVAPDLRDADDLAVLAAAVGGHAACVVTGDRDLLVLGQFRAIPILAPRAFWELESASRR